MKSEIGQQHPIQLIVQYYRCFDDARQEEIDTCLRNNLLNPHLAAVHLLTEEQFDFSSFPNCGKIIQTVVGERLTYKRAFRYANEVDQTGALIWILSNADIYFDDTLRLVEWENLDGVVYALTRHDVQDDGSIRLMDEQYAHGSQDAWMFRVTEKLQGMFTAFKLGIPGCDHRIAFEFVQAGYVVLNPSLKLVVRHLDLARNLNVDERTTQYVSLLTEDNFISGKAASPPYQHFLYPTMQLSSLAINHFRDYLGAAASIKKLEITLTDRNNLLRWRDTQLSEQAQQLSEQAQQLSEQAQQLSEQAQQLTEQTKQIAEHEQHINALYETLAGRDSYISDLKKSLSWRITAPLRKVHSVLSLMMGAQAKSASESPKIENSKYNNYLLTLLEREPIESSEQIERTVDVLLPVYNGYDFTKACIESVLNNSHDIRLIVIDDASPDNRIWPMLSELNDVIDKNVKVIVCRNESNMGFVKTVNKGFEFTLNDFVILNSDTEVPPGWIDRLFTPFYKDSSIATVTPFSNAATICSFPKICEDNPLFPHLSVVEIDGFFEKYGSSEVIDIPTGVGFCMAFRRSVVEEIGFFNEALFGRGYGEENDFCMRVRKAGYRNVIAQNLFVFHKHGGSFSRSEKKSLVSGNMDKLVSLYPDYPALISNFIAIDPLKDLREALSFIISTRKYLTNKTVAILDFDLGGGSGLYSSGLVNSFIDNDYAAIHIKYSMQTMSLLFNSNNSAELEVEYSGKIVQHMHRLFALLAVDFVIVNQLVSWPDPLEVAEAVKDSGVPFLVLQHDYFYICPNWVLLDKYNKFCNASEDLDKCADCLCSNKNAEYKHFYGNSLENIQFWKERMNSFLMGARQVVCFSSAAQSVLKGFYPGLTNTSVVEHAIPDRQLFQWEQHSYRSGEQLIVGVIGGIGEPKGIKIISDLLENKEFQELPVKIVVFGNTSLYADGYQSPDGKLFVYGKYSRPGLPALLKRYSVSLVLMPSVCPETFSFTTSEAILLGYPVICFDIGAQAERVKKYQCGVVTTEFSAEGLVKIFITVLDNPSLVEKLSIKAHNYVPKTVNDHFSSIMSVIND